MDEVQLAAALHRICHGESIRSVAKRYRVSRHYLTCRFESKPIKRSAQKHRQALSEEQEFWLVQWVLLQARLGWAPQHNRFRLYAQSIISQSGNSHFIGKRWHVRFFKRWPQLKTTMSTGIDFHRINGASRDNIEEFFSRLTEDRLASIPPEHTWNFDEIGAQIGLGDCPFVIGPASLNEVFTMDTARGEWSISLEAISADGKALPPLVIFKGKAV